MTKIRKVKDLDGFRGHASLYELLDSGVTYGGPDNQRTTCYVVISTAFIESMFEGGFWETFIFPSTPYGSVLEWIELEGSLQYCNSHERVIKAAGWTLVD